MKQFSLFFLALCLGLPLAAKRKPKNAPPAAPQRAELSVSDSRRLAYFFAEGSKQKRAGNMAAAHELFLHCLRIDPTSPEALYEMGFLQFSLQKDSAGAELLRQAAELDPQNPWYTETLAAAYLNQNNFPAAIPVLERLAVLQSKRTDVLSQLADLYKGNGQLKEAISALDRIELLEGRSVQTTIEKYTLYRTLGNKKRAFAELQALEREFPYDLRLSVMLGQEYIKAGQEAKGLACYDRVRRIDPTNETLLMAQLDYYDRKGMDSLRNHLSDSLLFAPTTSTDLRATLLTSLLSASVRDSSLVPGLQEKMDSVLRLAPSVELYTLQVGYLAYQEASPDTIARVLHNILHLDPANEMALSRLLPHYLRQRDLENAIEICRAGINSNPENLAYHFYLGICLYQQKRPEEATAAFEGGLRQVNEKSRPDMVSDLYSTLGDCYYEQGRRAEAYAAYDSCLVYNDDNAACLNNYAYYLTLQNEQLDKAEAMAYRAIKLEPLNKTYLDTYAWALYVKGNVSMAKFYIDRVVSPSATDEELLGNDDLPADVLEHAADIYASSGLDEQAARYRHLVEEKKKQ